MKIVFAGPSIHGLDNALLAACEMRPPAGCGDVLRAVVAGADAIGLIDGVFESERSVWHKEMLFALASGVRVMGAASIGALRAAECQAFGMEGIGAIFEQYRSGERICDADVALAHAPAELGYVPLTEALVDIEPVIARLAAEDWLGADEAKALLAAARHIHFKQRTWNAVLDAADFDETRRAELLHARRSFGLSQKQRDASEMIAAISSSEPLVHMDLHTFEFSRTAFFDQLQRQTPLKDPAQC
ncbi:TfuA-like protein [Mesorhizobium sp. M1396]|uniref:TfuA-like protein n=1 Tax=Mesorhizobium sp. M1396 TaxID=2957095 RepID=UPI00333BE1DD